MRQVMFAVVCVLVLLGTLNAYAMGHRPGGNEVPRGNPQFGRTAGDPPGQNPSMAGGDPPTDPAAPAAPVPEPATMLLLGSGVAGFIAWRKMRSK